MSTTKKKAENMEDIKIREDMSPRELEEAANALLAAAETDDNVDDDYIDEEGVRIATPGPQKQPLLQLQPRSLPKHRKSRSKL